MKGKSYLREHKHSVVKFWRLHEKNVSQTVQTVRISLMAGIQNDLLRDALE